MLSLDGFAVQYLYGARLFGGVDAEFGDGEIVAVYGGEGSGKTSFLKALCGAERAEGSVLLDGEPVVPKTDKIVMVFDDGAVFGTKSVYDNLAYPLKIRGFDRAEIAARVTAAAEETGISACLNMRARTLTPADRRRMSLARLLVRKARLYLVDEPAKGLTREDAESVFGDFMSAARRLAKDGATVIYSTSDRAEALAAGGRIAVLVDGEVKQIGTYADIRRAPESIWAAQAIDPCYNFLPCILEEQDGVPLLVFGEGDAVRADALRGRTAPGYMHREVYAGWYPGDADRSGKTAPTDCVSCDVSGYILRSADGIYERCGERRERVFVRPGTAKVTLFDRANECSIMTDGEVAEEKA